MKPIVDRTIIEEGTIFLSSSHYAPTIIFNFKYNIKYNPISEFHYSMYDTLIGNISYEPIIESQLPNIIKLLNDIPDTRQALISVNSPEHNSCLISIQCQLYLNNLYVTVNMRSQNERYRKQDAQLINYVTGKIIDGLNTKQIATEILVNVGNYHNI